MVLSVPLVELATAKIVLVANVGFVSETESAANGDVVPIPTKLFVAINNEDVPTNPPVLLKYAVCPIVPKNNEEVATLVADAATEVTLPNTELAATVGRAEKGRFKVELAAVNGIPVAPVITKPLLPRPQLEVVLNIVEITGVAPPVENIGLVAVTEVTVPCGCAVQPTTPLEFVVKALVPLQFVAGAPVIAKLVVVAFVVEPAEAKKSTGNMTWLGRERVAPLSNVYAVADIFI